MAFDSKAIHHGTSSTDNHQVFIETVMKVGSGSGLLKIPNRGRQGVANEPVGMQFVMCTQLTKRT